MNENKVKGGIFGIAVGDALGVPFEFKSREYLQNEPIKKMEGYGTHNQPPGTWSDDSSLTFILLESLCEGFDFNDIANKFTSWLNEGYWTPHGNVFDVGNTTRESIRRLERGVDPLEAGGDDEWSNGNGSLMRILPIAYYVKKLGKQKRFDLIHQVSSITHAHSRSLMSCVFYVDMVINILDHEGREEAYNRSIDVFKKRYDKEPFVQELSYFDKILSGEIDKLDRKDIESSGYVIDTLEASLWSFLNSESYKDSVLKAVNLGGDTDTVGAVTGGIAGAFYGFEDIPTQWLNKLAKRNEIEQLIQRFIRKF